MPSTSFDRLGLSFDTCRPYGQRVSSLSLPGSVNDVDEFPSRCTRHVD